MSIERGASLGSLLQSLLRLFPGPWSLSPSTVQDVLYILRFPTATQRARLLSQVLGESMSIYSFRMLYF